MGDVPAGHISKGIIHAKVDALVNHKNSTGQFDKRMTFLAALVGVTTSDEYIDVLKAQAGVTPAQADYLNRYFYKYSPDRWWPTLQPIFPILHQGLIKTIEEAGDTLLVDSYWMPVTAQVVETIICKSPTQVTRIFLTPPPGGGPSSQRRTPAPMWAIKTTEPNEPTSTNDAIRENASGGVSTWRIQDFDNSTMGSTAG